MTHQLQFALAKKKDSAANALCVFIEPAPYILALKDELVSRWSGDVIVRFVSASLSQEWSNVPKGSSDNLLPSGNLRAAATLFREILKDRPSVVFVAGWGHPVVIATMVFAHLVGAKVVSMSDTHISSSSWLLGALRNRFFKLIDVFVPAGNRQKRYLLDAGVEIERIVVGSMTSDTLAIAAKRAANGPACRSEIRKKLRIAAGSPTFLYVGRLEAVKGLDILLAAWTSSKMQGKGHLLIVGDGALHAAAADHAEKHSNISFVGRKQGEDLWSHFFASDVLVLPSRKESWGLVVNEALAASLPVIVSDCAGCVDDLVQPGKNGLIYPNENIDELALTMSRFALENDLRETLSKNGLNAISGWTSGAWASNVLSAWSVALSTGR